MLGLPCFPLIFLFMKCKGGTFAWACLITFSNRFNKNFLPKRSHSPEIWQNWILWFTRVGEPAHISKISYLIGVEAVWHTVLICCTMSGTEQPKEQPQIADRGSNPVPLNQFLIFFFSIRSTCSRSLFSFANILFFMWLTSFHLINLKFFPCLCSNLFTEN